MEVNSPFSRFKQAVNILINNFANLLEFIPYINNNFIIIKITITNLFIVILIFIIIIIIISIMSDYYQYYELLSVSVLVLLFLVLSSSLWLSLLGWLLMHYFVILAT